MTLPLPARISPARRALAAVALAAAAVLALASCSSSEPAASPSTSPAAEAPTPTPSATEAPVVDLQPYYTQQVRWEGCGGDFQCATVKAPLDYANPAAGDVSLAVIRLPASDPGARVGSLLVNPGGPGASGVDYARSARAQFTAPVRAAYDIVGFDPRGVAGSEPVECLSDKDLDAWFAYDPSPDTSAEEQGYLAINQKFADGCEASSGRLLPHIGTPNAARDMDVIRAVVGDEKLNYLGASYGTLLGATYADLFPDKVGRLVLDGAIDPTIPSAEFAKAQGAGFEVALAAFVDDCLTKRDCPLPRSSREAGIARIQQMLEDTDAKPLKGDRPVTQALTTYGLITALYDNTNGWPVLRQALTQAFKGDGSTLLYLADLYADRDSGGTYTSNSTEVFPAISCLDRPDASTIESSRASVAEFEAASPTFGSFIAWGGVICGAWPVASPNDLSPLTAPGAAPILVIGTLRDPATPYAWAQGLANQLESGVLLTWDGDGHTAYNRGSTCINRAVEAYLVQGSPPADGTTC